jgi:predicted pyridoxine 5'-phosphate oxidase superfamily flavin-nucleotide-binding protein
MGILTDEMRRVVAEQRLGFVATVCPDGTPNLSPKGTTRVWDADHLMFANICSPGTVANLRRNPAIEINVVDTALRKGYRFKGTATIVTEGPLYEQMMQTYRQGEHALEPELYRRVDGMVLVRVERAAALTSPAYDRGASEAEVAGPWLRYWETLWEARARS